MEDEKTLAEKVVDDFLEFTDDEEEVVLLGGEGTDFILDSVEEMSRRDLRAHAEGIREILVFMVDDGLERLRRLIAEERRESEKDNFNPLEDRLNV